MESSRRLAAIMFTDIVGYTALMGKDSAKALELVRINRDIQKPLVEKHGGKWLKEMGDGAMAQFNTALDAVNCAVEIQESARGELEAKLRVGIHLGDITIENDDIYGDGVNIAARLESITDPGGIYISESIEKAIQGQTDIQAKYLGEVKLKNVAYGVRTYAVQGVGLPVPGIRADQYLTGHFWAEVQRRGLVRTGATYLVLSVLMVLLLPHAESIVNLPDWAETALLGILIAGFSLAMYLAWNFERSPEGFVRTTSQQSWQNPYKDSQRKPLTSNVIIVGMALIIVGTYLYPRYLSGDRSEESLVTDRSIAVLPFISLSDDPEKQYLADGVKDAIRLHLSKIEDLRVVSRTSAEQYREADNTVTEICEELDVAFLLEGSFRKYGDQARLTVQLIQPGKENIIWENEYDREWEDIFAVESEVAQSIAKELQAIISPDVKRRIEAAPTTDITAYDLYLRGRNFYNSHLFSTSEKDLNNAERLYKEALKIDSTFALAYVGLGSVNLSRTGFGIARSVNASQYMDSVGRFVERALSFDSDLAEAYYLRARYYTHLGEFDKAIADQNKAISLNPNMAEAYQSLGHLNRGEDDYPKAIINFKKALSIEKGGPLQSSLLYSLGGIYLDICAFQEAEQYYRESVLIQPDFFWGYDRLWWLSCVQGKFEEALDFAGTLCKLDSQRCLTSLAYTYTYVKEFDKALQYWDENEEALQKMELIVHRAHAATIYIHRELGDQEKARQMFEERVAYLKDSDSVNRWLLAGAYAAIGDVENALMHLKKIDNWSHAFESFLTYNPIFESLWDNEEFKAFVEKLNEEKAKIREEVFALEAAGEL